MAAHQIIRPKCATVFVSLFLVCAGGCKKSADEALVTPPKNERQAATQIEQVFESAPVEIKQSATIASSALRSGDYEKAVVSLVATRDSGKLTPEQGIAVHNSMVTMEMNLIRAMEAGDPKAKKAYQTLKKLKRN
jgi:hypothetical protein